MAGERGVVEVAPTDFPMAPEARAIIAPREAAAAGDWTNAGIEAAADRGVAPF